MADQSRFRRLPSLLRCVLDIVILRYIDTQVDMCLDVELLPRSRVKKQREKETRANEINRFNISLSFQEFCAFPSPRPLEEKSVSSSRKKEKIKRIKWARRKRRVEDRDAPIRPQASRTGGGEGDFLRQLVLVWPCLACCFSDRSSSVLSSFFIFVLREIAS